MHSIGTVFMSHFLLLSSRYFCETGAGVMKRNDPPREMTHGLFLYVIKMLISLIPMFTFKRNLAEICKIDICTYLHIII